MFQLTVLLCYLAATALLALSFSGNRENPVLKQTVVPAAVVALAGLALHSVALVRALFPEAELNLNLANTFSLLAWQIAVMALVIVMAPAMRGLSALLLPLAAAGAVVTGLGQPSSLITAEPGWELQAHILLSAVAYGLLSVAAALAILTLLQHRRLRQRRAAGWTRILPPLETLERTLHGTLGAGFGLLTLGVFSGLIFVEDLLSQHLVHKTVLSLLAWLIFGVLILGRWRFGWRGKKAVYLTLGGFAALGLAYFGSRIILLILGRQWG